METLPSRVSMFGSVRIETSNGSSAAISSRTVEPCTLYSDQHLVWLVVARSVVDRLCAEHWHAVDMLLDLALIVVDEANRE